MFARKVTRQRDGQRGGAAAELFDRIGGFLRAQGLTPEPAHYAFAHRLLTRDDELARRTLARFYADGVRLGRKEIEALGGRIIDSAVSGGHDPNDEADAAAEREESEAKRLVAQTHAQVESVAAMMRAMHDETRDFGRDLAESAAAFGGGSGAAPSDEVVRLTRAMIRRVADAETRLEQAAAETDTLRAELAEAQQSARRDPLTGLPNRRAFDEAFAHPAGVTGRCLAVCDIDRFKAINDGFGHAVGDRVLSAVARILADECDGHFVARQGGEEFAVILGCPLGEAVELLDMARAALGRRRFRARDTDRRIGRVTFSAGIVAVLSDESAEAALARADTLLYRAKAEGRDRVIAG